MKKIDFKNKDEVKIELDRVKKIVNEHQSGISLLNKKEFYELQNRLWFLEKQSRKLSK